MGAVGPTFLKEGLLFASSGEAIECLSEIDPEDFLLREEPDLRLLLRTVHAGMGLSWRQRPGVVWMFGRDALLYPVAWGEEEYEIVGEGSWVLPVPPPEPVPTPGEWTSETEEPEGALPYYWEGHPFHGGEWYFPLLNLVAAAAATYPVEDDSALAWRDVAYLCRHVGSKAHSFGRSPVLDGDDRTQRFWKAWRALVDTARGINWTATRSHPHTAGVCEGIVASAIDALDQYRLDGGMTEDCEWAQSRLLFRCDAALGGRPQLEAEGWTWPIERPRDSSSGKSRSRRIPPFWRILPTSGEVEIKWEYR